MYLYLKQKVFALREKFTFFDERQNVVFTSKGSFFALPKKFIVYENDAAVAEIRRAFISFLPKFSIYDLSANTLECKLKQKFSFMKNFALSMPGGDLRIDGSLFGYEFDIKTPEGHSVLSVHKKYISWGDTYQVYFDETRIAPKIAAAIVVAIDNAVHPHK